MQSWIQALLICASLFFHNQQHVYFCQANPDNDDNNHNSNNNNQHTTNVRVSLEELGKVQGTRSQGLDFFGGIPYASPPVGRLRWAPPEEPPSWKPHILDASQFGPDCHQIPDEVANPFASMDSMSEDCLYLNIYTPAGASSLTRRTQFPVMVWFHGGAFQTGAAKRPEYDARRLAQEEHAIVVTVNYRLGALGFMVASELGLLGNFGLMDQRAALYFVKRHIAKFGGNPNSITLFGESAGAVMIGLHLQMENPDLFHKAILQSNPMGYQFRSVVVADFLGDAMRRAVDCRDLQSLRAEPVEEIMRAQSALMGIPRSVGDFFTWGPTLTHHRTVYSSSASDTGAEKRTTTSSGTSIIRLDRHPRYFSVDAYGAKQREANKFAVNVSQPMLNLHLIPDHIPIIIGTNRHEGEMFVHSAFPLTMSKPVYWMFVGALFKDSATRVLKHYRPYIEQLELEAQKTAQDQMQEEESKQFYMENEAMLEAEYQRFFNSTNQDDESPFVVSDETVEKLVKTFNAGGAQEEENPEELVKETVVEEIGALDEEQSNSWFNNPFRSDPEKQELKKRLKEERMKQRALKDAAKVKIDYRPVMSRIINDYLFRCSSWHYAHLISKNRVYKRKNNNVYVYRFSQPTHVPGYKECWGKACHTAELPYVFATMDVIRSNYSTLSKYAQEEAPVPPDYRYTQILKAHRGELEEFATGVSTTTNATASELLSSYPKSFQKILKHFFGDYFIDDPDEEIASDMARRWVAFARTGDPNYEGAKIQWLPWRYTPKEEEQSASSHDYVPWKEDFDVWSEEDLTKDSSWSDNKLGRAFRRRALEALHMEVIEDDGLRTELKRTSINQKETATFSAMNFLAHLGLFEEEKDDDLPTKNASRQVQRIAQEMGVLGTGLKGSDENRGTSAYNNWDDDFFPQLLELKWPPEDRLIERDCTCDFWEKIRYRY